MFQLSIIDAIFIQFALVIVIFGNLLHLLEPYVPVCIRQGFRYGKFGYNGNACAWVSWIEIPKSYFKHFYISSTFCSFFALCIAMYVYCFNGVTPEWFLGFLNFWCCSERVATVSRTSTFFALLLLYLQCLRRLYETHCIQVFSPMGKMNISHYIVGHFHYFGAVLAILSRASGFTKYDLERNTTTAIDVTFNIAIAGLFLYAWINQFRANITLANLRKDKNSGCVVTHKHVVPNGGWFEVVSSPHMFFEVLMYISLGIILHNNLSWWFVMAWVLSNQTSSGVFAHQWYKEKFNDYPKVRKAIYPYVL
ncbi:polyprenol reductase-like [Ctenocephalides felis]|uniref:polyprenol reductase-like n=1 Tax=Ctenocephalides felis TaxID=7515 RepID=UPI000E6E2B65|nr:polyprenol reductase-like [Ctenocephalides felis]XP_026466489.1 polyprenol reductase-like [Ctenocephalides felis]